MHDILMLFKMRPGDYIQLLSLIIAAAGLFYLIRYVTYTKRIAEQAVLQTESFSKPAIIAIQGGHTEAHPRLRNIGTGPALDVEWQVTGTDKQGKIDYIEPGQTSEELRSVHGLRTLTEGAIKSGTNKVAIHCSYRSISGTRYHSVSDHDLDRDRFSTTFGEG